ncbi:MAG: methyl-accepting chemotaxis protein [Gammaproteobacteria bacterium]
MAKEATGPNKLMIALSFVAFVLMIAFGTNFWMVNKDASQGGRLNSLAREAGLQSQSLAKNGTLAVVGDRDAFQQIANGRDRVDATLQELRNFPVLSTDITNEISLLSDNWQNTRDAFNNLLTARDSILVAQQQIQIVNDNFPQLFVAMDQVANKMAQRNGSRNYLYHLGRQGQFGQRLHRDLNTLVFGGGDVQSAADRMASDAAYYGRIVRAFFDGDPELGLPIVNITDIRSDLDTANIIWGRVDQAYQTLASMQNTLLQAHTARNIVIEQSDTILDNARTVERQYQSLMDDRPWSPFLNNALGGSLAIILLILFYFYTLGSDTRRAASLQQEQQEKNQDAILRLLDELSSLADGDLTIKATVTEDITGAIADSINFAIEALRDLVVTVNDTALRVDAAAKQTEATASHLAEAANNQSIQITSASGQIAAMAKSSEQVSANAERSAKVAQQSVEIANKGGEAVRRTIDGMSGIRETIQETSKRIKRLGESSQEIGDIVELINDIAEQTNILALNAAIQASMAGEAGRGFAVVADEVQRLAERSANATKQIEGLVKTIQTDTNEAVISMEQSTAGVVGGAQLAENAGSALDEIVKVSAHIATLIQSISTTARQQSTTASDVSRTMSVIQEITSQTSEGSHNTARNIGKLAILATELRKSVAGFKLPGMGAGETLVVLDDEGDAYETDSGAA